MEDAHAVVDELEIGPLGGIGIGRQSFYAVYDGHNGKEAADFVCSQLHGQLEQELLVSAHRVHPGTTSRDLDLLVLASLRAAFALTDETYVREGNGDSGCTAVAALLLGARLYVANLGDARCVLCRAGEALAMSEDHSPDRPDEVMRVQGAGGFVENGRVMGKIAVARAFGDAKFKDPESSILKPHGVSRPVVSAEPDFVIKDVDGEGNEFLLLACDGLFDVMTNQAATDFVRERLAAGSALPAICEVRVVVVPACMPALLAPRLLGTDRLTDHPTLLSLVCSHSLAAQDLANHALQIGSTDNVSVMVVKLTPPAAGAEDRSEYAHNSRGVHLAPVSPTPLPSAACAAPAAAVCPVDI